MSALAHMFLEKGPVTRAVVFRMGLALWTICYWAPRVPHAAELYARPFMRKPGPFSALVGIPYLPEWFVTGVMLLLIGCCVGFLFSRRPRRYHIVILLCIVFFHTLDGLMVRAYGAVAYTAWWLLLLVPYDQLRESDGTTRRGPLIGERLLAFHWCGIYCLTALAKLRNGEQWTSGRALWRHLHGTAQGDWLVSHWFDIPMWLCQVGAWGIIVVELAIAVAIWFPRTRRPTMVVVVLLHLSMLLTLRVSVLFPLIMWLHLCLFIRDDEWRALQQRWNRLKHRSGRLSTSDGVV